LNVSIEPAGEFGADLVRGVARAADLVLAVLQLVAEGQHLLLLGGEVGAGGDDVAVEVLDFDLGADDVLEVVLPRGPEGGDGPGWARVLPTVVERDSQMKDRETQRKKKSRQKKRKKGHEKET